MLLESAEMPCRPRILCVDDREDGLAVRKRLLQQFGCDVLTASNAAESLLLISSQHVDLAIIDYHLIGETGDSLAKQLRASRPELPLIMLSGDVNLPEAATVCVDAVFIKGISNPSDLLFMIQELLPDANIRAPRR